jgi:hypothetical protein
MKAWIWILIIILAIIIIGALIFFLTGDSPGPGVIPGGIPQPPALPD